MSEIKPFMYGSNEVRTVSIQSEPWFVAKDVCAVLEMDQSQTRRLDEDEKGLCSIQTLGGIQEMLCVNEPGLYTLILGSRKPEAKQFKRWITHEVIPSIRKHGAYMSPDTIEKAILNPDFLINLATELKNEQTARIAAESKITEQKKQLKDQETPVAIYNLAISAQNTQSMNEVAKILGTGRNRLFNILREESVIIKDRTVPYQRYIDAGYFVVRERPRASGDTVVNDPVSRVTAKGFDFIARLLKRRADRQTTLELEA
ncbi:BRO family protein [Paenibacillus maysiensis]|uniref:BRO family protein n=1 Tax=Paenibacillus maysiensis TaxID=1155954 RepID=UPI00047014E3|nr:phage antirepressor [Paenibacillus maysiensis]